MAEKEVCVDVTKTSEESSGRVEGESLLLPLLQGLLDVPDNDQTADSGTESGEDLRNGLLIEVQNVLAKLANSLKSKSTDMSEERRDSLLQLVTRLQTGLSQPTYNDRRHSGHERFSKKRRHNRHTVGVSSEELENARKLIEEIGLCGNKPITEKHKSQEQISVPAIHLNQNVPAIKNVVAKPYQSPGSTSQSASCTSSTVNTPTEVTGVLQFSNPLASIRTKDHKLEQVKPKPETVSSNFLSEIEKKTQPQKYTHESNKDFIAIKSKPIENTKLQSNPIYSKPAFFPELDDQKINNRFNNKKLKLKRANTIDIPKPVHTYESEDDYDSDTSLVDKQSSRRNSYLALRGPIRVGRNSVATNNVPIFEPKTESDKKFMAFINKHNERNDQSSPWAHQGMDPNRGNNWNNRFGNIRTVFEKASVSTSTTPVPSISSARNFWKRTENAEQNNVPRSRFPQRRSEYTIKEKEESNKVPWSVSNDEIVTGSLKVETKGLDVNKNYKLVPQPLPVNKFSHAPTSAFAAIPKKNPETNTLKSNVTGHVIKTNYQQDTEANAPLFLYSPKPLISTPPSPTPWTNDTNTVQKLVTTKFGYNTYNEVPEPQIIRPRKVHKNPPFGFSTIPESVPLEKITAPYINKSVETPNTVRKLSDQFNNKAPKQPDTYLTTTSVKSTYIIPKYSTYPVSDYTQYPPQVYGHYNQTPKTYSHVQQPQLPTHQKLPYKDNTKEAQMYKTVTTTKENRLPEDYIAQSYLKLKPPPKSESELSSSDSSPIPQPTPQYNRQISQESVKEYEAAVTRVMKGPVSQQAVTVPQNSPRGRDQHDLEVAFNLKNALQKFTDSSPERKLSIDSAIAHHKPTPVHLQKKSQSFKNTPVQKNPNFMVNGKPLSMESTEINENGESVITSKFHIPVTIQSTLVKSPTQQMIRKADIWNQLMYDQQVSQKPAPVGSPNSKSVLKSRSSHSLAVPTIQFQAGMTKDEVALKKKTVEAYFSGSISPQSLNRTPSDDSLDKSDKVEAKVSKSSINRKKTSEKISINKHSTGVVRSQTLPNIACPDLLDESKVEESFEDLFRSNA